MATAKQFLKKAASYIGIGGTDNIFNTWYWGFHCYNPDVYPWCACFISYVGVHDLKMSFDPSASAAGVGWQGRRVADEDVQPGDWVLFTWDGRQDFSWADHIAVVEWTDINGSGAFGTIDGNSGGGQGVVQRNTYDNNSYYGTCFFRPPYDTSAKQADTSTKKPDRLHAIDISSHQAGLVPSEINADVVIIKVSGGTHYENPYWQHWAEDVLESGKLLGLYHYAVEKEENPVAAREAAFFLKKVKKYKGQYIPILDWEADALSLPASWPKEWLDIVARETGATPWFYGYAGNINSTDYSCVANAGYPLWMASYLNKYIGAGFLDTPDQTWSSGSWSKLIAYQYTSQGRVKGYNGNLDLSVVYCTPDEWRNMCSNGAASESKPGSTTTFKQPYYNVMCNGKWCGKMKGRVDTTGSSDDFGGIYGATMQYLALGDAGKYQVHTLENGWLPCVDRYDLSDEEYGMAGDGSNIDAVRIFDSDVHYQTHNLDADWNSEMIGTHDTGGSGDDYAGEYGVPQDAIRIWRK